MDDSQSNLYTNIKLFRNWVSIRYISKYINIEDTREIGLNPFYIVHSPPSVIL